MKHIQTIDIDNGDKEHLKRILQKIASKECCLKLQYRISTSLSHYHIRVECSRKCDLCRIVFDDSHRYRFDRKRPEKWKGLLWNTVIINNNNKEIVLKASKWVTVKDISNGKLYKQPLRNI